MGGDLGVIIIISILQTIRTEALYWATECPEDFSTDKFPMFLYANKNGSFDIYGLPWHEYNGFLRVSNIFRP